MINKAAIDIHYGDVMLINGVVYDVDYRLVKPGKVCITCVSGKRFTFALDKSIICFELQDKAKLKDYPRG